MEPSGHAAQANDEKGKLMATWIWIVIAGAAALVLAAVVLGWQRGRAKRQRREQAQELRQEAQQRHRTAKERENMAKELKEQATSERKEGDKVAAQAAKVDPDRD
jgi:type II secretory pathway pseudopilin PulG